MHFTLDEAMRIQLFDTLTLNVMPLLDNIVHRFEEKMKELRFTRELQIGN